MGNYSGAIVWVVKVQGTIVLGGISWGAIIRRTVVERGIVIEPLGTTFFSLKVH